MKTFHILTADTLTLYHGGEIYTAASDTGAWDGIVQAIAKRDWDEAANMCSLAKQAQRHFATQAGDAADAFQINEDIVTFEGVVLGPLSTDHVLRMVREGHDLNPIRRFMKKLEENPSSRAREQALEFVVTNGLPINDDGDFLAYKKVTDDYKDCHTETIDNSVGAAPAMPRRDVDDDPNRACSRGLHVCSKEYLRSFGGDRLVAVGVNPKDVVSVPNDYHNAKMRVCEYTVLSDLPLELVRTQTDAWHSALVEDAGMYAEPSPAADDSVGYGIQTRCGEWRDEDMSWESFEDAAVFDTIKNAAASDYFEATDRIVELELHGGHPVDVGLVVF